MVVEQAGSKTRILHTVIPITVLFLEICATKKDTLYMDCKTPETTFCEIIQYMHMFATRLGYCNKISQE
jgi:hypothetical protein